MENDIEKKRVGAGIITMSVLYLIGQTFVILGSLFDILFEDQANKILAETGIGGQVNVVQVAITLLISLTITIAIILILCKKPIGAFLFIVIEVLSFIYSAIISGVSLLTPLNLIFPGLMIFFIYRKKDIYFVKQENV
ncbi:hypothetical protein PMY56_11225 [Clostridium tertium]|uniref:hypothetical protein n=1 Tax=Clostridium TaxID=1485 RepID=UPI001158FC09|nr:MULTISPECIES: hypothetical protein [Clostridium]MBS5307582.1 hypothetical protein [Clostridium sp.]MDB1923144.1 hypothetical protein [Clostridium tertium]MDB1926714.1 hypothetical protein [Clostridium tertium]MDB1931237.1 hypothetical protein [Clostridium tertium]MDB1931846.1 hypothetical protein [Clostridium tertium]